jgi:hypothetical protein
LVEILQEFTMAPWKDAIPPFMLAICCCFNTYFSTQCLLDLSFDLWAQNDLDQRASLFSAYYTWKQYPPIVGPMMMGILCLIPIGCADLLIDRG